MTPEMQWEPLVATGYAMLLVVIAGDLEWMGRHANKRTARYHTAGFRFQKHLDHWECPTGMRLLRAEIDNDLRVIRYQAPAHTCNRCPVKANCTDSDNGRVIEIPLDPWLSTEIGLFHRGISLALLSLAALILVVELLRNGETTGRWILAGVLIIVGSLIVSAAHGLLHRAGM